MSSTATLYNTLPGVIEADSKFVNREAVFSALQPLLAEYDNKYGVCLVHRHCRLEEGELMVKDGNVTEPKKDVKCYPERWLDSGEPYEFSLSQTSPPPDDLFIKFREIVGGLGVDVLGLFASTTAPELYERTEGRQNIVDHSIGTHDSSTHIVTTWVLDGRKWSMGHKCIVKAGIHINDEAQ